MSSRRRFFKFNFFSKEDFQNEIKEANETPLFIGSCTGQTVEDLPDSENYRPRVYLVEKTSKKKD